MLNDQERDHKPRRLVPCYELHPLAALWSMIAGVILLVFVIAGIIAAWGTFMAGTAIMIKILVVLVVVLVPAGVIADIVVLIQNLFCRAR